MSYDDLLQRYLTPVSHCTRPLESENTPAIREAVSETLHQYDALVETFLSTASLRTRSDK